MFARHENKKRYRLLFRVCRALLVLLLVLVALVYFI